MIPGAIYVKLAGLAAVLLAVFLGYRWFTGIIDENATLKTNAAVTQGALESERVTREEIMANGDRVAAITTKAMQEGFARAFSANKLKSEVANVPPSAQSLATCAPAVSHVLRRVRESGAGGGEAGSGAPEAAGKPADLRR